MLSVGAVNFSVLILSDLSKNGSIDLAMLSRNNKLSIVSSFTALSLNSRTFVSERCEMAGAAITAEKKDKSMIWPNRIFIDLYLVIRVYAYSALRDQGE